MTLKVLSSHAVMAVTEALAPAFERDNGVSLSFGYDPTNAIRRRIDGGEPFDVAIVTRPLLDELLQRSIVLADTAADIARSGLGVSVRKGATKPNIDTVEDFKRALLAAKSIVRSKDGASGVHFETLLPRLGIGGIAGKIIMGPSGRVAALVARGEAELAIQQISELLPVEGADYVGPLPEKLQLYSMFSAGVSAACKQPAVARKFIAILTTPHAKALLKAAGLDPA